MSWGMFSPANFWSSLRFWKTEEEERLEEQQRQRLLEESKQSRLKELQEVSESFSFPKEVPEVGRRIRVAYRDEECIGRKTLNVLEATVLERHCRVDGRFCPRVMTSSRTVRWLYYDMVIGRWFWKVWDGEESYVVLTVLD